MKHKSKVRTKEEFATETKSLFDSDGVSVKLKLYTDSGFVFDGADRATFAEIPKSAGLDHQQMRSAALQIAYCRSVQDAFGKIIQYTFSVLNGTENESTACPCIECREPLN